MSAIGVGDQVMVVRWPHKHVNPRHPIGHVDTVRAITPFSVCGTCSFESGTGVFREPSAELSHGCIPLSWLKKIDPLSEPKRVERPEEVKA